MLRIEAYGRTECGPVRDNNEDALIVDTEARVFLVADGMGGHAAGEVASDLAIHAVHSILTQEADPEETRLVDSGPAASTGARIRERLRYAMNQASTTVRRRADADPNLRGMGTTLVAVIIEGNEAHIGHVGDSRAYLLRAGKIKRLTRDHTVVQQEIDAGRLSLELARLLPQRNILTQSLGFHGVVEPDTSTVALLPGDVIFACTDGITDPFDDASLAEVARDVEPERLADVLTETALARGTQDNATLVVVAVLD